jgi:hypothetical protein
MEPKMTFSLDRTTKLVRTPTPSSGKARARAQPRLRLGIQMPNGHASHDSGAHSVRLSILEPI